MSWLASIGQRAREAAGAVGNVGVTARAALNSVTSFADDRARRIGQALHARVTGRGHSIDDAVARVERAVVECVPAQRPAMLRRWLAALRASSSAPSAPSNDETEAAKASGKEDVDTSNESSAAESSKESSDSADSSGKEKEWASLEVAEKEKPDAARAGGEQDVASTPGGLANAPSPINAFGLLDAGGVGDAALTFFEEPSTFRGRSRRSNGPGFDPRRRRIGAHVPRRGAAFESAGEAGGHVRGRAVLRRRRDRSVRRTTRADSHDRNKRDGRRRRSVDRTRWNRILR